MSYINPLPFLAPAPKVSKPPFCPPCHTFPDLLQLSLRPAWNILQSAQCTNVVRRSLQSTVQEGLARQDSICIDQ